MPKPDGRLSIAIPMPLASMIPWQTLNNAEIGVLQLAYDVLEVGASDVTAHALCHRLVR